MPEDGPEKRKPGRPTIYTPELVEAFLEKLEEGLVDAEIAEIPGMPKVSTVFMWRDKFPAFAEAYARAHAAGVMQNEAEMLREARRTPEDKNDAAKQRTLVDTLKWRLSKRLPKEYGDKQQVDLQGSVTLADAIQQTLAARKPAD